MGLRGYGGLRTGGNGGLRAHKRMWREPPCFPFSQYTKPWGQYLTNRAVLVGSDNILYTILTFEINMSKEDIDLDV